MEESMTNLVFQYSNRIHLNFSHTQFILPSSLKSQVDSYWENQRHEKTSLKNGDILSLEKIDFSLNKLIFTVNKTNYAHYLYCLTHNVPNTLKCRSLACNVLLKTSDNYLVLAKMATHTSLADKIKFIGGSVSLSDISDDTILLEKCLLRELAEETGLHIKPQNRNPSYIITRNQFSSCLFLFLIEIDLNKEEFKKQFTSSRTKQNELDELLFVQDNEEKINLLLNNPKNQFITYLPIFFKHYYNNLDSNTLTQECEHYFI